jgi:hypothetical protein|tara:strand:+ start:203 stop:592 length:390 start_codon:yes stop_codon:yes gene_type:complete
MAFEKFEKDFLNNKILNSHEKVIFIICYSFRNAPYGCRISHKYLMQRTGIGSRRTLTKYLDRLTMFGLLARRQELNGTNHYVFDKETMQEYISHNTNKRRRISLSKKKKSNPQINQQIGNVINMVKKDV